MARSLFNADLQVQPGTITRALHNTTTAGSAVINKVIAGTGITLSSTGADAGTGDVTINSAAGSFPGAGVGKSTGSAWGTSYGVSGTGPNLLSNAGPVHAAGTTTIAAQTFTAGTNKTTPAAGDWEFDGTAFYATAQASTRQVVNAEQCVILSAPYTLIVQTAAQKMFNASANGAVTLAVGTYEFECEGSLTGLSSTASAKYGFALGGTATFTQGWSSLATKQFALSSADSPWLSYNTGASTQLVAVNNSFTTGWFRIRGTIRITAAGTVIPQISTTIAVAAVVGANSFFRIWPVGNATVTTVGNWS